MDKGNLGLWRSRRQEGQMVMWVSKTGAPGIEIKTSDRLQETWAEGFIMREHNPLQNLERTPGFLNLNRRTDEMGLLIVSGPCNGRQSSSW